MLPYPLYILPFDHRNALCKEILHIAYPPTSPADVARAKELKTIIYDGFLQVWEEMHHHPALGILVDEEFGDDILRDAKARGITHFLTVEASSSVLSFAHGERFAEVIAERQPTGAKVLVHYTLGDEEANAPVRRLLRSLSEACTKLHTPLMAELLVKGPNDDADNIAAAVADLKHGGLAPSLWKLEGVDTIDDWKTIARATGDTPVIVLGRGADAITVDTWLTAGKKSGIGQGFAVGRTVFEEPLIAFLEKKCTRAQAVTMIADHYRHHIQVWEKA